VDCTKTARIGWLGAILVTAACGDSSGGDGGDASEGTADDGQDDGSTGASDGSTAGPDDDGGDDGSTSGGSSGPGDSSDDGQDTGEDDGHGQPGEDELPYDPDQLARVCERGNDDPIAQALCAEPTPSIDGIDSLYDALGLQIIPAHIAIVGNSTSLAARSTSAINPRVMVLVPFEQGIGAVTFSRGEMVLEMVGYDQAADALNFYLFTFFRDCNDTEDGCGIAERFTPEIESDWTKWSLYQDVDLENTTFDCNTCHQPGGPGTEKLLLGHQAEDPWMHWFPSISLLTGAETMSSEILTPLFLEMHGDEDHFAGIPVELLTPPNPGVSGIVLQQLFDNYWIPQGGPPPGLTQHGQPHVFDSAAIEAEGASGSTATWDGYYAQTLAGERLPVPHHRHDVTDPDKRAAAVASYTAVLSGAEPPESMLDPRDVFSAQTEEELGFRPREGASAEEILHHVCQRCHNDELDQTLTRARFNAERPDELTAMQKDAALERLMEPDGSKYQMPPRRFATLPDAEKQALIEFLQQ
jgi:hypothetical protein